MTPNSVQPEVREDYACLIAGRREALSQLLNSIMGSAVNVVCEIGCGHGHYLTAYAQEHRNELCIGIDIVGERVARAERKRNRADLERLHFVQADAGLFLQTLPPAVSISRVFILFPDPWPKTRHHKHRVIQPDFLARLAARMTQNAELFFRTDHLAYFDYAKATFAGHPRWLLSEAAWPFEHESVFQQRAPQYYSFSAKPRH